MKLLFVSLLLVLLVACTSNASGNLVLEDHGEQLTDCCTVVVEGVVRTCAAPGYRGCASCDAFCEHYSATDTASSSD